MVWIPRRHRSLLYKLLILIPVAWLTIAFLMYNGNNTALNSDSNEHIVIAPVQASANAAPQAVPLPTAAKIISAANQDR